METTRDMWGWRWLQDAYEDARFGLRTLRKSMGFTVTAILMLALGIGANTAIFSMIDAALLRSLPVVDVDRLVVPRWQARVEPKHWSVIAYGDCGREGGAQDPGGCSFSGPFFEAIRQQRDVFSSVAAFATGNQLDLSADGNAEIVRRPEYVSGDYFQTLGIMSEAGRTIADGDDTASAPPVIVLSHSYWRSQFRGDASAIGKTVLLNKVACTIVGVAEPNFDALSPGNSRDIWLPLSVMPKLEQPWDNREVDPKNWWLVMIARLKPGVTREGAQVAANTLFVNETTGGEKPLFKSEDGQSMRLAPAEEALVGRRSELSTPLYVLLLAVGTVLLIACANVAGLLLSRASARQREMAVRFALGASRGRLLRQLLTESLMLSQAGGMLGLLLAWWCVQSVVAFVASSSDNPVPFQPSIDPRVLLFTAVISILTGVIFGLAPALRGMKVDLTPMLKAGARGDGQTEQRGKGVLTAGNALVVAQVALSIVILAAAGLLVRTLQNLKRIDPGFDTHNLLMFSLDPTMLGYKPADSARLFNEIQDRVRAMPGVVSATYSWSALMNGSLWRTDFHLPGRSKDEPAKADVLPVGLVFFETMRIPLVDGREFGPLDLQRAQAAEAKMDEQRQEAAARLKSGEKRPATAKPADNGPPIPLIVNQAFARKYFPAVNPLGQRFAPDNDPEDDAPSHPGWEIVGVVGDARYNKLTRNVEPTMYLPNSGGSVWFELRTAGDPERLVASVRAVVRDLDSNLPLAGVNTQVEQIDRQIFKERIVARLASFFGLLALTLACIGLYGLISYEVSRRTREIGIRAALGAERRDVLSMVLRQGIWLASVGALLGTAIALGLLRYTKSLLFGVSTTDPLTFVSAAVLLVLVMLAASYVPARRAMSVDPVIALRYE
jgi:predicted permease